MEDYCRIIILLLLFPNAADFNVMLDTIAMLLVVFTNSVYTLKPLIA